MIDRLTLPLLGRACLVAAATHGLIGVAMIPGNADGWLGGLLYVAIYALPMLGVGLLVGSGNEPRFRSGGWLSLLLAVGYSAVIVLNWSTYRPIEAVFGLAVTAPTVVLYLLAFWWAGLRGLHGGNGVQPRPHSMLP